MNDRDTRRRDEPEEEGEPTAAELPAEKLERRAREQGISLTGPDGLLKQLTKTVIETALNQELTEHLGHEKNGAPDPEKGNVRNGTRSKTVHGGQRPCAAGCAAGPGRDVRAADRAQAAAADRGR